MIYINVTFVGMISTALALIALAIYFFRGAKRG